jgi:UDP:flavonoid glycosyltransferase YjiC (YdhE family)
LRRDGFDAAPAGRGEHEVLATLAALGAELADLPPPQRPDRMFHRVFGAVQAGPMLEDLLPVARAWAPSLVVRDAAEHAGPIAAAGLGVPWVTHAFGPLLPAVRTARAGDDVAPLWRAQGLEPRPHGGAYDHLYVDIYPPSLQDGERAHVPAVQPLGPGAFATGGDEELPAWLAASSSRPLVYVTFGTIFTSEAALAAVVEGVRSLPVRVVVTVGPRGDPGRLGPQPDHVHVARYIPQARLLDRCAAVVSHGGSGTFLAGLAAGLPQLCVPWGADQFLNAAACERSGCGLALAPDGASPAAVAAAVARLLDEPAFRARAGVAAREIAAMPSPHDVAARLHATYG